MDPFSCLVEAYFGSIPDAFRRPNTLLYEWLDTRIRERRIRGIIFKRYTWCDTWHGEEQRMKERMGLPFLSLDMGDDARLTRGACNRVQSFLEILS
jgi:benzoyl-CoA reductase/2-hydroxyglutaryl-CoA dehydratase subunit BcrC/BadD/HgdB